MTYPSKHGSKPQVLMCEVCALPTPHPSLLALHRHIQAQHVSFMCVECDEYYGTLDEVLIHVTFEHAKFLGPETT